MPKAKPESECVSSTYFLFSNHACFVNFVATQAQSMVGSTLSCLFYPRQKCTLIPITIEYLAGQLKVFSLVLVRNVKSFGRTKHLILSEFPIPMNAHGLCNKRDRSACKWSEIRNNSDSFSFRSSTVSFTASNHHLNVGRDPTFYVCDQCYAYSHFHRQTKTMEARGDDVSENGSQLLDDITNKRWGGAWDSANDVVHYIYLKLSYFKNVYMFNLSCMHLLLLILSPAHLRGHDQRWSQPFCCL